MERQLRLPKRIMEVIAAVSPIQPDDPPEILQRIQDLFQRYADNHSVCSRSKVGRELTAVLPEPAPLMAVGQLAGILGIPVEEMAHHFVPDRDRHPDGHRFVGIWSGYVKGMMPDIVRRSDFAAHRSRLDVEIEKFRSIVEAAQRRETELKESCDSAKSEWASVKNTFEEQMRLRAPATYWRDQARRTFTAAMWALVGFVGLAAGVIWSAVDFGPALLARLAAVEDIGNVATLTVVSVPAFTALWGLRHVARLFVTNLERSNDAKMRETMTTTFLALSKEGSVEVGAEERLMVLDALFRPATPAKSDDGHFGGALEILTRQRSQS